MLKLSELVKLKKSIIALLGKDNIADSINDFCDMLLLYTKNNTDDYFQIESIINDVVLDYANLLNQSSDIKNKLNLIIENINVAIDSEIDRLNQSDVFKKTFDTGWSNIFKLDSNVNHIIEISISKYSDWHYPGLRLGCRHVGQKEIDILTEDNHWLRDYEYSRYYSNCMVASDPLYFCDQDENFIKSATDHFNELYQKRIRTYKLHDIDKLPSGQFGFIFCWMFLNYVDQINLEQYLKKSYNLLRSGGVIMFSYNNVEFEQSAKIAELGVMSAISFNQLTKLVEKIGFQILNSYNVDNSDPVLQKISWVEIKKPGVLQTVKRSQALGEIK